MEGAFRTTNYAETYIWVRKHFAVWGILKQNKKAILNIIDITVGIKNKKFYINITSKVFITTASYSGVEFIFLNFKVSSKNIAD